MCIYEDCYYLCLTKKEHHSRYARMRRKTPVDFVKSPSPKVNWDVVEQLKIDKKLSSKIDDSSKLTVDTGACYRDSK